MSEAEIKSLVKDLISLKSMGQTDLPSTSIASDSKPPTVNEKSQHSKMHSHKLSDLSNANPIIVMKPELQRKRNSALVSPKKEYLVSKRKSMQFDLNRCRE